MNVAHSAKLVAAPVLLSAMVACATQKTGNVVRPDAPRADQALGQETRACPPDGDRASVLVVDWDAHTRMDLEAAARNGLAAVRYTCEDFEIIDGCAIPDEYQFTAVTPKEELIRIVNRDELSANLPLGGARLEGKLKRGTSLDLALILVGKRSAATQDLTRIGLGSECERATHVVHAMSVGGFALSTSAEGAASSAAEVFSLGARAGNQSERRSVSRDGDVNACRATALDASEAPERCGSAIRLDLRRIANDLSASHKGEPQSRCPAPLVFTGGACRDPKATACHERDPAGCRSACDQGDGEACFTLAGLTEDAEKAGALLERACTGGSAEACLERAEQLLTDLPEGIAVTEINALAHRTRPLYLQACKLGSAEGCGALSSSYYDAPVARFEAARRGCKLGSAVGCFNQYSAMKSGEGTEKNPDDAVDVAVRACRAGKAKLCSAAATALRLGKDIDKDLTRAREMERLLCLPQEWQGHCLTHGQALYREDREAAQSFYENICQALDQRWACEEAKLFRQ